MNSGQETVSTDSFGIQNTMELGIGNTKALDSFLDEGSATTTATSDELQTIVKEITDPATPEPTTKGKTIIPPTSPITGDSLVDSFLGSATEEEDEVVEDETKPKQKDVVTKIVNEEATEPVEGELTKFAALANDLYELGVFTKDYDEGEEQPDLSKPEDFLERLQVEKKQGAIQMVNDFIGNFGEDYQRMFDAVFVKGVDPKDYLTTYENIINFSELDLTIEANQEKVIRQGLKDQGFEPDDVETELERFRSYGDLESVSARIHKVLVKKEATKLAELEQNSERELQNKANIRSQYIQNVNTVLNEKVKSKDFDGLPINPKIASELQDFLLVDKYKTASGETLTDFDKTILELKRPENHAQKVKVALILKMLEKDPTLSSIQKAGVTKSTNTLFNSVVRQQTVAAKTAAQIAAEKAPPKTWF